ncbi:MULTISPECIES: hypothetical protein [Mycolicibacterium]|uniref:Alanine and proline rich membrane protein n=1 Tax=Mycolicibacterium gilvum (strain PYR-GCK) TaxID=350054 RepID=A4T5E3_MYCGI|nr:MULTISPECIES: hypothetical protein [Mycolicibacterium]ABP43999.1 hypothetical protein Mflv_1517 [Mycolicibacterium gilvum PYR-GCK]MBV5243867.1 hypothetical protein [Mycolicibacterium sp. PAM1]
MYESSAASRRTGQLVIAALVVALAALAVAVYALVSAPSGDTSASTADQTTDPKTRVCNAFALVRNAVSLQTNANLGPEPVATQAVAANARLATLGGGQFLLSRLDGEVPDDLAEAVRTFANNLEYIGMGQLAGTPADDANQVTRMNDAQTAATQISELCQ